MSVYIHIQIQYNIMSILLYKSSHTVTRSVHPSIHPRFHPGEPHCVDPLCHRTTMEDKPLLTFTPSAILELQMCQNAYVSRLLQEDPTHAKRQHANSAQLRIPPNPTCSCYFVATVRTTALLCWIQWHGQNICSDTRAWKLADLFNGSQLSCKWVSCIIKVNIMY